VINSLPNLFPASQANLELPSKKLSITSTHSISQNSQSITGAKTFSERERERELELEGDSLGKYLSSLSELIQVCRRNKLSLLLGVALVQCESPKLPQRLHFPAEP
jgi:hypothetical protein